MALSIFSSKKDRSDTQSIVNSQSQEESKQAFFEFGKQRAEAMGGSPQIIHPMLHTVCRLIQQKVQEVALTQVWISKESSTELRMTSTN